jgi:tetratricopeptide (TPR) repeat protein
MHIRRSNSRLTFRRQRQRPGCLSYAIVAGVLVGVAALALGMLRWAALQRGDPPRDAGAAALAEAEGAFARGDLDTTIENAQAALLTDPRNIQAALLLTRALIYRSYSDYDRALDRQTALDVAQTALAAQPNHPDLLAAVAFALQANGQPVEAADYAERALNQQPDHALARLALALSYAGAGSFQVAFREAQAAAAAPNSYEVDALRTLAIAYSDLGRYRDALATIERAIDLNERLIPLHFERALYALQIGDADTATVSYYQVIAFDSTNVKAYLRLCELSGTLRQRESALSHCTTVTQLAPDWSDGWYQLGREYFLQGDFRGAQNSLHRCAELQTMQGVPIPQRRFECWYLQGQAAEILGDCVALLTTYNEFREMSAGGDVPQTWVYPPEGPPNCR